MVNGGAILSVRLKYLFPAFFKASSLTSKKILLPTGYKNKKSMRSNQLRPGQNSNCDGRVPKAIGNNSPNPLHDVLPWRKNRAKP